MRVFFVTKHENETKMKLLQFNIVWFIHNVFCHPAGEILFLCGFSKLADRIHDATIPNDLPYKSGGTRGKGLGVWRDR